MYAFVSGTIEDKTEKCVEIKCEVNKVQTKHHHHHH